MGPLEVVNDGHALPLERGRQRLLLALLLLRANHVVGQDVLVNALWGESPPATAVTALHGQVSRLRRLLGGGRLETRAPGYVLHVAPGELDLHRFRELVAQDRPADALALWRGPPLADLRMEEFASTELAGMEELRVSAIERRFELELDAGRHADLVGDLTAAVRAHPLRERFTGQLMVALYRSGRQADALQAYRRARARLVDELGVEPGEELRRLHQGMLLHDPSLTRAARSDLPAAVTSFVGRLRELDQLRALLMRPGVRLLTLTGPGGAGKTRLALEVARAVVDGFGDGACFVPLASVSRADLVPSAIARALHLRQSRAQSTESLLKTFLAERELLLVLDNLEHLMGAALLAAELLAASPGLTILATSRVHLRIYGETEYAVPPLTEPGDAVRLFADRAAAVLPDFALTEAVPQICARLDGLPLAIELAAARVRTLTPEQILTRLDRRLDLLTDGPRDVPARQQTLRDTLLWSHDLLSPTERRLFARLAVFAGGWSSPAATAVCGAAPEDVDALVDKSLVRPEEAGRFGMLETIRELASELLTAGGEELDIQGAHARWCLAMVDAGGLDQRGEARAAWFDSLDAERENLAAALTWTTAEGGDNEIGLRLAAGLSQIWTARGQIGEGRRALGAVLARATQPSRARGRALSMAGLLAILEDEAEAAERSCREGLALLPPGEEWHRAVSLNVLGTVLRYRSRYDEARRSYHEALALAASGDHWWPTALAEANLGALAGLAGGHTEAVERYERAAAIAREGGDSWMAATCLMSAGRWLRWLGDLVGAGVLQAEALRAYVALDNLWGVAVCVEGFAGLALARGDHVLAARLYGAEEAVRERAGLVLWPTIRAEREAGVEATSSALGEDAWAMARAQGRALSRDEVIAAATLSPSSPAG